MVLSKVRNNSNLIFRNCSFQRYIMHIVCQNYQITGFLWVQRTFVLFCSTLPGGSACSWLPRPQSSSALLLHGQVAQCLIVIF